MEYQYTIDDLPGWLGIPHGEGVLCEAPLDFGWSSEAFELWKKLIGEPTNSFEGNLASKIHNPTIRIFCYLLTCTIFVQENSNKTNAIELLFLQGSLTNRKINFAPFMLEHMCAILERGDHFIWRIDYLHCNSFAAWHWASYTRTITTPHDKFKIFESHAIVKGKERRRL